MLLINLLCSTLRSGLKSVVFISVLPVYHWDSCGKKSIALDFDTSPSQSSTALQNFVLRIRMAFDEVNFGKTIRFYSLPKYFTDVESERCLIDSSWAGILEYIDTYVQYTLKGNPAPLLYVFNDVSSPAFFNRDRLIFKLMSSDSPESKSQASNSSDDTTEKGKNQNQKKVSTRKRSSSAISKAAAAADDDDAVIMMMMKLMIVTMKMQMQMMMVM